MVRVNTKKFNMSAWKTKNNIYLSQFFRMKYVFWCQQTIIARWDIKNHPLSSKPLGIMISKGIMVFMPNCFVIAFFSSLFMMYWSYLFMWVLLILKLHQWWQTWFTSLIFLIHSSNLQQKKWNPYHSFCHGICHFLPFTNAILFMGLTFSGQPVMPYSSVPISSSPYIIFLLKDGSRAATESCN